MDDGEGGVVAFVGGINPVQSYWDTPAHDSLDVRRVGRGNDPLKGSKRHPRSMIFSTGSRDPRLVTFLPISSNVIMARVFPIKM